MRADRLKFNPDKMEVLLVGPNLTLESPSVMNGVVFPVKARVHSLGNHLDPALLPDVWVVDPL